MAVEIFQIIFFYHFVWNLRDVIADGTLTRNSFFKFLFWKFRLKQAQSSDQIQEEGWEVQDGSTRVRKVVNSGATLMVAAGGGFWEATRECVLNVVCIFFHRSVFSNVNWVLVFLHIFFSI